MGSNVQIDSGVLQWLLGAAGAFLLFLLGLGVKDLSKKLDKIPLLCVELERMKARSERSEAEFRGEIRLLEQRLEDYGHGK